MKELILLRHAKSSWDNPLSDIDRPLMAKGIDRISAMIRSSISLFESVDEVYSSPANRALHTAVLMLRNAMLSLDILKVDQRLYTFDAENVISCIESLDFVGKRIVLVGHNPAFTIVANRLGNKNISNLSTAAWAHLTWENEKDLEAKTVRGDPKMIL